jgi:hypothetical protein
LPSKLIGWALFSSVRPSMTLIIAATDSAAVGGYADQSHMIAEFRRFSGMTPQTIAASVQFHPFIWRARERCSPSFVASRRACGFQVDRRQLHRAYGLSCALRCPLADYSPATDPSRESRR